MFTEVLENKRIDFEKRICDIKYIRIRNLANVVYFSSELMINENESDLVIMDDFSLNNLKNKIYLLLPSIIYSRMIYDESYKKSKFNEPGKTKSRHSCNCIALL